MTDGSRITGITAYILRNAFYIEFAKGKYEKTRKISESVMVDEDKDGKVLGIEILDASENIPAFDPKNLKMQTA